MIDLVYIHAGGGHYAAAKAIKERLSVLSPSAVVNLIDLQHPDLLGKLDIASHSLGMSAVDIYNAMIKANLSWLDPLYLALSRFNIHVLRDRGEVILRDFWMKRRTSLVVSLVPLFNEVMINALKNGVPYTKHLTVMTDFYDIWPGYWLGHSTQYCLVPTEEAWAQAKALGLRGPSLRRMHGVVLSPSFYSKPKVCKKEQLRSLNLDPSLPTLLMLFGGYGSNLMLSIAKRLDKCNKRLQMICICGNNPYLAKELQKLKIKNRIATVGFTDNVPKYMSISDIFVGKPGPGSLAEAAQMRLPIITCINRTTLVQERANARWVEGGGYGLVLSRWKSINRAVDALSDPLRLSMVRESLSKHENNGLEDAASYILDLAKENTGDLS